MKDLVIGLDCSTTATKALAFNRNGKVVAHTQAAIPLSSPSPNYYEQDSNDWWRSVQYALKKLTRRIDPQRIAALAISNQRETFVPLDEKGNPLRPAIIWLDERCKSEVEPFAAKIGKRTIHRITGKPPDYAPVVYRLAWMKKYEPRLFKNIGIICDVQSFVIGKLTGFYRTSWASADPLGLFDLKNKNWSPIILSALNLSGVQLPEIFPTGAVLGTVSREASKSTGLLPETRIIAGGGDGQAAGLGSNVLTSERAYLNLGTAVVAGVYGTRYRTSQAFRTMSSCSEKGYYYECSLRAGTFALDWLIRQVLKIDPLRQPGIYKQLEREAQQVSVGSNGLFHVPYICGVMNPYWDINARGAFVGLSSSHQRGHLYRSMLEGIAFEQLLAIGSVEQSIHTKVKEFVAIGGGAANDLWCHILADVTGRKIVIPETTEASALGAGIAAAVGAGWYRTFEEAADEMTGMKKIIIPDKQNLDSYRRMYPTYKSLYPKLTLASGHR